MAVKSMIVALVTVAAILCSVDAYGRRPAYRYYYWNRILTEEGATGQEIAKAIPSTQLVLAKPARNNVFNTSYILEDYQAEKIAIKIPTTRGPYCFIFDTITSYNETIKELQNRQTLKHNGEAALLGEAPDYIAEGKINATTLYHTSKHLYLFCYFALWRGNVYQLYDETLEEFETAVYDGFSWPVVGLFAPINILLSTTIPIPPNWWWY